MVVEDEYYLACELDDELRAAGATVLGPAPSVRAALAILECGLAPDAAVLDMNLKGELAYPVADALAVRRIPFIVATGYDQASLPERYAGCHRMEKPIDMSGLLKRITVLIDGSRS
ncbi:response regulator (plasmid) [Methylobacterium currus]|uniref:response regulator n=1 Tax=Methylobacterium currus TaxID=2051553 RepID=UPI001E4634E2|nr:response regulator [Methylobacterium currus]UHC20091.1 response regulator [Methylobacterium currus]